MAKIEFNNCDEVLLYFWTNYDAVIHQNGNTKQWFSFEGDKGFFTGNSVDGGVITASSNYEGFIFIIGDAEYDNYFPIFIYKNGETLDGSKVAAHLPAIYREEMIATVTGQW